MVFIIVIVAGSLVTINGIRFNVGRVDVRFSRSTFSKVYFFHFYLMSFVFILFRTLRFVYLLICISLPVLVVRIVNLVVIANTLVNFSKDFFHKCALVFKNLYISSNPYVIDNVNDLRCV